MKQISTFTLSDLKVGDEFSFEETVSEKMIDRFAELSGDYSTIHMDDGFAKNRGFVGRIAHGALLTGFLSRLVGMKCPGENAILQSMNTRFSQPVYVGQKLRIRAIVEQISQGANTMLIKASIENIMTRQTVVTSKIQIGFTSLVETHE